ncbi:translation initiation factor IF3-1, mitochondrial [Diospyros lotus]|uniref:translation initiation factor IF3-1, mitochondrial n=1 Tax=Diospyros lotus TaxID=55363 RepID=UPI002250D660|nr:translation initiation factor IF3-1, mitochondrial [Diospyros lotus]
MASWRGIKPSKLKLLSNQFRRCYVQVPGPALANQTASRTIIPALDNPNSVIHKSRIEFGNVRFYAAPVQAKSKQEEKDAGGPRLNEQIRAEFVRIVSDEGHCVVSRWEALERARSLKLDLVEVQRNAKPPVCKLMDYNKEKYKQQVKEKDRSKNKSELTLRKGDCKEVRFSAKTEQKDLQMKADTIKRLMERGYRVKCAAMGTEEQDLGGLLNRLSALIEDVSIIESGPRVEKKQAYVIVRHVKFGPSKKGSGKKTSKVASSEVHSSPLSQNNFHSEEIVDAAESGAEAEDEIHTDEPEKRNPSWSVFDADDGSDNVFDFRGGDKAAQHSGESSPLKAPTGIENRYRRQTSNTNPSTKSMDLKGFGSRDSTRSVPKSTTPHQRQSQFFPDASPTRKIEQLETDASVIQQEQLHRSAPDSSSPGYGMFSTPKPNDLAQKNGTPAGVNRYKAGNNFDSTRHNPSPRGDSSRLNRDRQAKFQR